MKTVTLYTDGACSGNPGPGGWGAILLYGEHKRELSGGEPNTTNNRMELTAVIEALSALKEPCAVTLTSDSTYVVHAVEKAIQSSDLGINPQTDGKVIRLIFPPLTEEKRKEIVRDVSKMAEDAKIALRSIRRDAIEKLKAMKKDGELTEDDLKQAEKKAQDITDKSTKIVDERSAAKQKEVLTI